MSAPVLHVDFARDTDRDRALTSMSDTTANRMAAEWAALAAAANTLLRTLDGAARRGRRLTAPALRTAQARFATATAAFDRDATAIAAAWASRDLPVAYRDGALGALRRARADTTTWTWTSAHQTAVTALTAGFYTDLVRRISEAVRRAQAFARAVTTAARNRDLLAAAQVAELGQAYPLGTVIYANQARHPAQSWAASALIAQATIAANNGTLEAAMRDLGCRWVQIADGPECGWVDHPDTDHADHTLRSVQEAAAYPIAHPGCRRELIPRPDLTGVPGIEEGQPV